jgi:MbtH protein
MPVELHHRLIFKVIVSQDNEYSLWLLDREDPPGWRDTGTMRGSASECLAHIKEVHSQNKHKQASATESCDSFMVARASFV